MLVRRRGQWKKSIRLETTASIREIAEVTAAKNTRIKKIEPNMFPRGILLNTFGKVINISPGPAFSLEVSPPENAKTAGTIMSPAKNAIPVSKISI